MNRQKLTELLHHPERVTARDASQLQEMAEQYPFASVLRILLAKSKQQQPDAREALATAALFTPNRHILRLVMENTLVPLPGEESPAENKGAALLSESPAQATPGASELPTTAATSAEKGVDIFDELQKNLKRLREERNRLYSSTDIPPPVPPAPAAHPLPDTETQSSASEESDMPALKQIIEEHQPLSLENPKVQEQRNLIDSFLENAPNLPRRQPPPVPTAAEVADLSEKMSFTPLDLATENLAKIMERQGKTEKAIDIYQKLLLKYPQKSAYFADCIERLKKNS